MILVHLLNMHESKLRFEAGRVPEPKMVWIQLPTNGTKHLFKAWCIQKIYHLIRQVSLMFKCTIMKCWVSLFYCRCIKFVGLVQHQEVYHFAGLHFSLRHFELIGASCSSL